MSAALGSLSLGSLSLGQLLFAQASEPPTESAGLFYLVCLLAFLGVSIFTLIGFMLFNSGWESYEERYLEDAERSVDDLFLTIPPQQLLWLQLLGSGFGFVMSWFLTSDINLGFMFGILGFLGPRALLWVHRRRRAKAFSEQLTGALNTITNSLRTGFALPKAFQLISTDMPKPICQEFGILVQELRLGIEIDEGLDNMLERMPGQDLDLVVTSIAIATEVGGNLAEVFDQIAHTIRERRRIEGRIDALTTQGKTQGILVALLPILVAFMLNLIDPTLMAPLFTSNAGRAIIGLMVVMEILGFICIWKITNIEV